MPTIQPSGCVSRTNMVLFTTIQGLFCDRQMGNGRLEGVWRTPVPRSPPILGRCRFRGLPRPGQGVYTATSEGRNRDSVSCRAARVRPGENAGGLAKKLRYSARWSIRLREKIFSRHVIFFRPAGDQMSGDPVLRPPCLQASSGTQSVVQSAEQGHPASDVSFTLSVSALPISPSIARYPGIREHFFAGNRSTLHTSWRLR